MPEIGEVPSSNPLRPPSPEKAFNQRYDFDGRQSQPGRRPQEFRFFGMTIGESDPHTYRWTDIFDELLGADYGPKQKAQLQKQLGRALTCAREEQTHVRESGDLGAIEVGRQILQVLSGSLSRDKELINPAPSSEKAKAAKELVKDTIRQVAQSAVSGWDVGGDGYEDRAPARMKYIQDCVGSMRIVFGTGDRLTKLFNPKTPDDERMRAEIEQAIAAMYRSAYTDKMMGKSKSYDGSVTTMIQNAGELLSSNHQAALAAELFSVQPGKIAKIALPALRVLRDAHLKSPITDLSTIGSIYGAIAVSTDQAVEPLRSSITNDYISTQKQIADIERRIPRPSERERAELMRSLTIPEQWLIYVPYSLQQRPQSTSSK